MGISASCQPCYPRHNDFVQLIKNANNFIMKDRCIWTPDERFILKSFIENLQTALDNTQNCNLQLPWYSVGTIWYENKKFNEYLTRVRLAIPRSRKIRKIFSYTRHSNIEGFQGFTENFMNIDSRTQSQLAHFYGLMAFLWSMYNNGNNCIRYFYKSDILDYVYKHDHRSIDIMMSALEKIYFTNKSVSIPANYLVMPTCSFRLLQGNIKTFFDNTTITSPRTYSVIPNPAIVNEPFYTLTPSQIDVFMILPPKRNQHIYHEKESQNSDAIDLDEPSSMIKSTDKPNLNSIHEDINSLVRHFRGNEEISQSFHRRNPPLPDRSFI
jgi:hypothetical protein